MGVSCYRSFPSPHSSQPQIDNESRIASVCNLESFGSLSEPKIREPPAIPDIARH